MHLCTMNVVTKPTREQKTYEEKIKCFDQRLENVKLFDLHMGPVELFEEFGRIFNTVLQALKTDGS